VTARGRYEPAVFPDLAGAAWAEVDLGALAERDFGGRDGPNPLLHGGLCEGWMRGIAAGMGADFLWGGHLEERRTLWRGLYPDASGLVHLGVDYAAPAGTRVAAAVDAEVVHSWADASDANGWGGRLVVRLARPWRGAAYLVYGHLARRGLPQAGERVAAGDVLGRLGTVRENGGWSPHLHVQCAGEREIAALAGRLEELDGYWAGLGAPPCAPPDPALLVGRAMKPEGAPRAPC
jgi:hypothetical protein